MRCWPFPSVLPLIAALQLGACNSTDVLDPSTGPQPPGSVGDALAAPAGGMGAMAAQPSAQPVGLPPASSAEAGTLNGQAAVLRQEVRVQLAPIVGASLEAVTPLTRRLSQRASERGIVMATTGEGATHTMAGYFSAISNGGETTVIYVWDVLDPAGNRLHRIQGQEKAAGGTNEGWSGVPGQTMEAVADKTIDQLTAWLAGRPG